MRRKFSGSAATNLRPPSQTPAASSGTHKAAAMNVSADMMPAWPSIGSASMIDGAQIEYHGGAKHPRWQVLRRQEQGNRQPANCCGIRQARYNASSRYAGRAHLAAQAPTAQQGRAHDQDPGRNDQPEHVRVQRTQQGDGHRHGEYRAGQQPAKQGPASRLSAPWEPGQPSLQLPAA